MDQNNCMSVAMAMAAAISKGALILLIINNQQNKGKVHKLGQN